MRFLRSYAALPNSLIEDTVLHYTSKVVYAVLAMSQRKSGLVKLTVAELVALTGQCETTVLQALAELEVGGFICRKRNWRFSQGLARPVFSSNSYKLRMDLSMGYTLISAALLDLDLTPAVFCVLLFLYCCAGRSGRAFPSIRYIAGGWKEKTGKGLYMAKSTVLRALKRLCEVQAVVKRACDTKRGDQSCNSYYMTEMVKEYTPAGKRTAATASHADQKQEISCSGGGSIFREASLSKKITGVSILRRRDKGVFQLRRMHKLLGILAKIPFLSKYIPRPPTTDVPALE